jgi:flagellar assembly protein FliH
MTNSFTSFEYRDLAPTALPEQVVEQTVEQEPQPSVRTEDWVLRSDLEAAVARARSEGMLEGERRAKQWMHASLEQQNQKIVEAVESFRLQTENYYSSVEVEIVNLALSIAARILHRESQTDRMLVAALAKIAVDQLHNQTRVGMRVAEAQVESWRRFFRSHEEAGGVKVSIAGDPTLQESECILETDLGTAEIGIESQLKEIERGFFDLLARRPNTR